MPTHLQHAPASSAASQAIDQADTHDSGKVQHAQGRGLRPGQRHAQVALESALLHKKVYQGAHLVEAAVLELTFQVVVKPVHPGNHDLQLQRMTQTWVSKLHLGSQKLHQPMELPASTQLGSAGERGGRKAIDHPPAATLPRSPACKITYTHARTTQRETHTPHSNPQLHKGHTDLLHHGRVEIVGRHQRPQRRTEG